MFTDADKEVIKQLPKELKRFVGTEDTFRLTKLTAKSSQTMVPEGSTITGSLTVADRQGKACIRIASNWVDYLRTSAVVSIIDSSKNATTFETVGGVYLLERL